MPAILVTENILCTVVNEYQPLDVSYITMNVLPFCVFQEQGANSQPMKEEDLIAVIDDVLRDDDKNNDGYIDYAEFAKSLE